MEGARGVPLAFAVEIVDILPAAAEEPQVFDPLDRAADECVHTSHGCALERNLNRAKLRTGNEQMPYWSNGKWRVVPRPL